MKSFLRHIRLRSNLLVVSVVVVIVVCVVPVVVVVDFCRVRTTGTATADPMIHTPNVIRAVFMNKPLRLYENKKDDLRISKPEYRYRHIRARFNFF